MTIDPPESAKCWRTGPRNPATPSWTSSRGAALTFAPESVMLDFEIAERSAIKELFPGTKLRGCFFHWKQCLIRKFKVVKGYPRDLTVRENLHCLFGLAFVPEPDVPGCWDMLKQILWSKSTDFHPVLCYMETEWIKNTTFPVQTWNEYNSTLDNDPRANNYSEGDNNALNKEVAIRVWSRKRKL